MDEQIMTKVEMKTLDKTVSGINSPRSTLYQKKPSRFPRFQSALFSQSNRIVKRIKRTKRMGTDFGSPSARPYPPQAE